MLEDELQRELQLAHIGARRADTAEARRVSYIDARITPIRMVQCIESFKPELQVLIFSKREIL